MIQLETKNGKIVPEIGLGTFGITAESVRDAVQIGYRLIDTSDDYANEDMIGQQLQRLYKEGEVKREDLFLQTKISDNASFWNDPLNGVFFWSNSPFMHRHTVEEVIREKLRDSKRKLRTDYLDSVLIHFPYPDYYVEMWEILCKIKDEEHIRYIGVSNFNERHFNALSMNCEVPSINQTYFSPIGSRQALCDYCNNRGIKLMTYSPLKDYSYGYLEHPIIKYMIEKYGRTGAQIVLRWNLERGSIPCPKSNSKRRLQENFDVLKFKMDMNDIEKISSLNYNYQFLPESKNCPGI